MSYSADQYAKAFVAAYQADPNAPVVANLLRVVEQKHDRRKLGDIVEKATKLLTKEAGGASITVTSARKLDPTTREKITKIARAEDTLTFAVDSELVAGIRITVDNEQELDYSFRSTVSRLFS